MLFESGANGNRYGLVQGRQLPPYRVLGASVGTTIVRTGTGGSPTLYFTDNFNRADGTDLGANWVQQDAANAPVAIVSQELTRSGAFRARADMSSTAMTDAVGPITVQAKLRNNGGSEAGVFGRSAFQQGYYAFLTGTEVRLSVLVGSGITAIAGWTHGLAQNTPVTVKLSVTAGIQKVWVDGVLRITAADTTLDSSTGRGGVGLMQHCFLDDFAAYGPYALPCAGLPAGYKFRAGTHVAIESGGTATLNLVEAAFPFTTVEVLNGSDEVVASLSPSGGVQPGDSFTFE